jgi:hypothetical protein
MFVEHGPTRWYYVISDKDRYETHCFTLSLVQGLSPSSLERATRVIAGGQGLGEAALQNHDSQNRPQP